MWCNNVLSLAVSLCPEKSPSQGFSQIPGQDFSANFAPVVNEVTLQIVLVYMLMNNLETEQFDVVAAFLYGELEEEIYMSMPKGYTKYLNEKGINKYNEKDHCLKLHKSIYGLVQAARQWWKCFKNVLENIGFIAAYLYKPKVMTNLPSYYFMLMMEWYLEVVI